MLCRGPFKVNNDLGILRSPLPSSSIDSPSATASAQRSTDSNTNNAVYDSATYPDINGDDWAGVYYVTDSSGKTDITASMEHDNNGNMWLRTSRSRRGHYFTGSLSKDGDMYLIDHYDNEIWTTHFGPATATHVLIADYVSVASGDLYIIDLSRELKRFNKALPVIINYLLLGP